MNELIQQFLDYCALKGKSPLTIRDYKSYLGRFVTFSKIEDPCLIDLDVIDRFQAALSATCSPHTQNYYLLGIRAFLRWLKLRKNMNVIDYKAIELSRVHRKIKDALSEKEVKTLLRATVLTGLKKEDRLYYIRTRAILEVFLSSGVRVSELISIKVSDIDLDSKWFRVVGKGNKERVCFINDTTVIHLKRYLNERKVDSPLFFPITSRQVERLVKSIAKEAGIEKQVSPHTLRRTFGVSLLRKGVDIRYVQEFLGHESILTTQFYTKVERSDLEKIYRDINKKKEEPQEEKLTSKLDHFMTIRKPASIN